MYVLKKDELKINIVREKFGETKRDKYYTETETSIGGFNSNSKLKTDKELYDSIKKSLRRITLNITILKKSLTT